MAKKKSLKQQCIDNYRTIKDIDNAIVDLLAARAEANTKIFDAKKRTKQKVRLQEVNEFLLNSAKLRARMYGLDEDQISKIFVQLIDDSIANEIEYRSSLCKQ